MWLFGASLRHGFNSLRRKAPPAPARSGLGLEGSSQALAADDHRHPGSPSRARRGSSSIKEERTRGVGQVGRWDPQELLTTEVRETHPPSTASLTEPDVDVRVVGPTAPQPPSNPGLTRRPGAHLGTHRPSPHAARRATADVPCTQAVEARPSTESGGRCLGSRAVEVSPTQVPGSAPRPARPALSPAEGAQSSERLSVHVGA